jgi:hypothetical protein
MPTSQPLGQLTATHQPLHVLVARNHGPGRSLMERWFDYQARKPPPRPRNGAVVELPRRLLN